MFGCNFELAARLVDFSRFEKVCAQQLAQIGPVLFKYSYERFEQFCSFINRIFGHCRFSLVIRTAKVAEAGGVASVLGGGQQA